MGEHGGGVHERRCGVQVVAELPERETRRVGAQSLKSVAFLQADQLHAGYGGKRRQRLHGKRAMPIPFMTGVALPHHADAEAPCWQLHAPALDTLRFRVQIRNHGRDGRQCRLEQVRGQTAVTALRPVPLPTAFTIVTAFVCS